jgi:hypothetical protein
MPNRRRTCVFHRPKRENFASGVDVCERSRRVKTGLTGSRIPYESDALMEVYMRLRNLALTMLVAIPLTLNVGCGGAGGEIPPDPYAGNTCVGAKQAAASTFCETSFDAWETWETDQDDEARVAALLAAGVALEASWAAAEADAADEDANCSDLALTSSDAGTAMEAAIATIAGSINDGLDLDVNEQAQCGAALVAAASDACADVLTAESVHISDLYADSDSSTLDAAKSAASTAFSSAWADATSGNCPTSATEEGIAGDLVTLTGELVGNTIVTPGLNDAEYTALTPGSTDYLGDTYEPQCMQGDPYRYFAKRGSVNKVLMYYMGGGACWDGLTCGVPICTTSPPDDLNGFAGGFADLTNVDNPFRDWNIVFVSYCTCDIHFGDATQDYGGLTVEHKGYHNAKVAEKWAREHFLNPEEVFVTGSSAGAYGAWFHGPLLHEVWPSSQIHVLADAGNGVITTEFLNDEFNNWNFVDNLPDIPGVLEAITEGGGIPAYTEAVAEWAPDTNWAHYSTKFDGGQGGQTGFYNVMLNIDNVLAWGTWWNASCAFGQTALSQAEDTYAAVPDNYRYYFGTGSLHTMFGSDKVYDDTTGGVPTIVDWLNAMLASGPDGRDDAWKPVLCDDCGLLLQGDPAPDPLEAPFVLRGEDTVVVCE